MDYRWHPSWGQTGPVDNRITDSRVPRRIRKKVEFYGQRRVNTGWGNISQANSRHLSVYKSRLCWKERDNHFQSTRKDKQDVISQQSAVMRHVKITYLHFMTKQPTCSKLCNTSSLFFFPDFLSHHFLPLNLCGQADWFLKPIDRLPSQAADLL